MLLVLALLFAVQQCSPMEPTQQAASPAKQELERVLKGFAPVNQLNDKEKQERDQALLGVALRQGTLEACQALSAEDLRQECEDSLRYSQILASGVLSQCEALHSPERQASCSDSILLNRALDSRDLALCQNIQSAAMAQRCQEELKAAAAEDCRSLSQPSRRQECFDRQAVSLALQSSLASDCEKAQNPTLQAQCLSTLEGNALAQQKALSQSVPKTPAEKLAACQTLSLALSQACKDRAYFELAFAEKDLAYCNQIADPTLRTKCQSQQQDNIDQFYLKKAMATKDLSACGRILNPELKSLCSQSIAP